MFYFVSLSFNRIWFGYAFIRILLSPAFCLCCSRSRQITNVCSTWWWWRLWAWCCKWRLWHFRDVLLWWILIFLWNRISVHNAALLFYFVEVYFGLYFAAVDVPPSSSSQALTTTPWGYGTWARSSRSPSWEVTRATWRQLRSTGAGSTWRQVRWQRVEACWNMFSRLFLNVVAMLWCLQSVMLHLMMKMMFRRWRLYFCW